MIGDIVDLLLSLGALLLMVVIGVAYLTIRIAHRIRNRSTDGTLRTTSPPSTPAWLRALTVLFVGGLLVWAGALRLVFDVMMYVLVSLSMLITMPIGGVKERVRTGCAGGGYVVLLESDYSSVLGGGTVTSFGYDLAYERKEGGRVDLYYNGFRPSSDAPDQGAFPFVGLRKDGSMGPSSDYLPLPRTGPVRVLEANARMGSSGPPPGPPFLGFMNVFVDPTWLREDEFPVVADCLAASKAKIDGALAATHERAKGLPSSSRMLKLGGIYYGLPPVGDPEYAESVADVLSDQTIPYGPGFRLYRGHSASGTIHGHPVEVSLEHDGRVVIRRDGVIVKFDGNGKADQEGVSLSNGSTYRFDWGRL